jgi:V/A-type H+-transporting ATPase subunit A
MAGMIKRIAGPVILAKLDAPKKNYIVEVGEERLLGEIIQIVEDTAIIQCYEDTTGLKTNEPVYQLDKPLAMKLGPGIISGVFDGVQRPLDSLKRNFIERGIKADPLPTNIKWTFAPNKKLSVGDKISSGTILGTVEETSQITNKILVPPLMKSKIIKEINEGSYNIEDPIGYYEDDTPIMLYHYWPVRKPRPFLQRLESKTPFITGQRVLDFLFSLVQGGTAMIPGGFGSGKTVLEKTIAQFSSTDIMIIVLCGERGNEASEALRNFMQLKDPRTDLPLIDCTAFIVNTSNMPVAARESSIYSGITIAEYYRDMGYNVSMLADSTSRWAEALRELSSRSGEMSGEEGFPNYMPKLLGQFYERAGRVKTLSGNNGSITTIGAVSPQGGDFSEPVTQYTMRFTTTLWALDTELARSRHFPAISWSSSYTMNDNQTLEFFQEHASKSWAVLRSKIRKILQEDEDLQRIVRLIGKDTLSEEQKGLLLTAEILREGFLQQNAYSDVDAYCSIQKTALLAEVILKAHELFQERIKNENFLVDSIYSSELIEKIIRLKEEPEKDKIKNFLDNLPNRVQEMN